MKIRDKYKRKDLNVFYGLPPKSTKKSKWWMCAKCATGKHGCTSLKCKCEVC